MDTHVPLQGSTLKTKTKKIPWLDEPSVYSPGTVKAPFLKTGSILPTAAYYWKKNKKHVANELEEARKQWILPTDPWFVKKLKDVALTTVAGVTTTGHTAMQTGWSITAGNIGAITASAVSQGNDIFRTILEMDEYSDSQKKVLMDAVYNPIVTGTMEGLGAVGWGAVRVPRVPAPKPLTATIYAGKKMQFEFNNAIKSVNKIFNSKKAKNQINPNSIKDMNDFVVRQTIVNPIVKKDIQALAIKTFEQQQVKKIGNVAANQIANKLREGSGIMAVAPLPSVGAAVTPKELLPALELKAPFFNPIKKVVDSLPVNEFDQIQVKDLKQALTPGSKKLQILQIRKPERAMILTKFDNFIGNLVDNNVKTVPLETVNKYIENNPIDLTINVGESFIPEEVIKEKSDAQRWRGSFFTDLDNSVFVTTHSTLQGVDVSNQRIEFDQPPKTISEAIQQGYNFGNANFPEKQLNLEAAIHDIKYPPIARPETLPGSATGLSLFEHIANERITTWSELSDTNKILESIKEFEDGKLFIKDHINNFILKNVSVTKEILPSTKISSTEILESLEDKIMYNLGYEKVQYTPKAPYERQPLYQPIGPTLANSTLTKENKVRRKQWVETLLNNFNTRKHTDRTTFDEFGRFRKYTADAPKIKSASGARGGEWDYKWNNLPITSETLTQMANSIGHMPNIVKSLEATGGYPFSHQFSIGVNLSNTLDRLITNLELRDIPEWPLFIDAVKSYQGFTAPVLPPSKLTANRIEAIWYGGWEKTKQNIVENQKDIDIINKKIKKAELKKPKNVIPYVYEEPYGGGGYETHITYKFGDHSKFDKYFEVRLTANDLSGYPDFYPEKVHFGNIKNIIGWTLATKRTINKTPLNPNGETMMVMEEFQAPHPYRKSGGVLQVSSPWRGEMTEKSRYIVNEPIIPKDNIVLGSGLEGTNPTSIAAQKEHVDLQNDYVSPTDEIMFLDKPLYTVFDRDGKWKGEYQITDDGKIITDVSGADLYRSHKEEFPKFSKFDSVEQYKAELDKSVDLSDIIKSRELGGIAEADWYKKVLWADIRFAYDNGFDYLAIPTSKTMKHKTKSGGNYDNMPAVAAKWGFDVISDVGESKIGDNWKKMHIGTPMENFGLGAPTKIKEFLSTEGLPPGIEAPTSSTEAEMKWLNENYGDDKIHIIDLRNREKVFEILNVPQQVGSLEQQMEQLIKFA
jgi:hypothetical protein